MSPLCKIKVSPFVRDGGGAFGVTGRNAEHEGVGSGGRDRAGGGEAPAAERGGGAAGAERAAGETAAGALPRAGAVGSGFGAPRQAVEQRHGGSGAARGDGTGARALPGLRPDIRAREAGGGARSSAVGGDAAPVDDRGWPVAGEGAAGDADAPEPSAAGVRGGPGADRRLAARLVRGSRAGVRADRVRRRRGCWRRGSSPRRRPRRT